MGSHSQPAELALAIPTPAERTATWEATHPHWGAALDLEDYQRREHFLTTVPQSRNGGITHWILTEPAAAPDARPVLSSCESIRKRCLVASPDGTLREGVAHGIASVFTEPQHRGNGYASKMMTLLGPHLATWQGRPLAAAPPSPTATSGRGSPGGAADSDREVAFSILFSDIGKTFYAKSGWPAYESTHLSFPPLAKPGSEEAAAAAAPGSPPAPAPGSPLLKHIGYHELAELCSLDEQLLRAQLSRPSADGDARTRVALIPDLDATLWHLMREDFMTKHIFGKTPTIRGAVYGPAGRRVWAVWTRGYYGGLKKPEDNTFHVLRVAVEDDDACDDAYLAAALGAILGLAREEAAAWKANNVELWSPTPRVRAAVETARLPHELIDRQDTSIACLMWYGEGEIDWVANEKFGWC
ncbi:hypothetical protein ACHAQA_007258 [Verticillium albo-atrum]